MPSYRGNTLFWVRPPVNKTKHYSKETPRNWIINGSRFGRSLATAANIKQPVEGCPRGSHSRRTRSASRAQAFWGPTIFGQGGASQSIHWVNVALKSDPRGCKKKTQVLANIVKHPLFILVSNDLKMLSKNFEFRRPISLTLDTSSFNPRIHKLLWTWIYGQCFPQSGNALTKATLCQSSIVTCR